MTFQAMAVASKHTAQMSAYNFPPPPNPNQKERSSASFQRENHKRRRPTLNQRKLGVWLSYLRNAKGNPGDKINKAELEEIQSSRFKAESSRTSTRITDKAEYSTPNILPQAHSL